MAGRPDTAYMLGLIKAQGGFPAICGRIASSETVTAIARTLLRPNNTAFDRSTLSNELNRWARKDPANQAMLDAARKESGSAHAEGALQELERAPLDRDAIQKAKAVADGKFRYAGYMDREQFGDKQGRDLTISVNVASMHLDALRHRIVEAGRPLAASPSTDTVTDGVAPQIASGNGARACETDTACDSAARTDPEGTKPSDCRHSEDGEQQAVTDGGHGE